MDSSSLVEAEAAVRAQPPPPTAATAVAADVELSGNGSGNGPFKERETEAAISHRFSYQIDALLSKADELEQRVKEVSAFYSKKKQPNNLKGSSSSLKERADGGQNEVACSKRMQEVMRQFGTILKNLSTHKWAWPFLDPVDVEALGLHDYYEIVKKPMDFSTIRKQMEANVYKNVREIYADVRLVFTNAMTYNDDDKSDIHVMARTLLERFEEKWLQLIHKVVDAEERQKDEEAQALTTMHSAQEAAIAKLARDTNNELNQLNLHLEELRELVIQSCRKMTTEEKRKLSSGIASLCPEYLFKALEIIAQENPNFQDATEEVDIDIDAQNEITLWRLKFFVKGALENQARNSVTKPKNQAKEADDVMKRKKLIYDALAKTARKRSRKPSP